MTDNAATSTAPAKAASPKKAKAKPKTAPTHPPVASMVNAAIKNLKERGGSSAQAIKKYIAANNKVDVEKLSPFIKRYLKSAVAKGALVQTKGKGASGSFKLKEKSSKTTAAKPKKTQGAKKVKKAAVKTSPKKKAAPKKKLSVSGEVKPKKKAAKKATKPKSPKKPKVVKKSPAKKTAKKAASKKQ